MSSPLTRLTPQGLIVGTLAQRLAQLKAKIQALPGLGPNVNLDPDTIDGNLVGILSESYNNLDLLAQQIYQCFDPNTATGLALSLLVQLNGITRQAGFFSIVTLHLTGTPGQLVPQGTLVGASDGSTQWATESDVTFDSGGNATVSAQCVEIGPFQAPIGTLTVKVTPVFGWDTVTNPSAAVEGAYTETDEELRIRRAQSTLTPAQSIADGIQGAIANLPGVTQCRVYENDTSSVDSHGLDPHSINVIVQGGTAADIAEQIWLRKSLGVKQIGSISQSVNDSQGNPHTMKYDVPASEAIYISIHITELPNYPTDGDAQVTKAIIDWFSDFTIGEEVVWSQLFSPINKVTGVSVDSLFIGTAPSPTGTANVVTAFNAIAVTDATKIVITH